MRKLECYEDEQLVDAAVPLVVSRMVFPDDDITALQVQDVMRLEMVRRNTDPTAPQGPLMRSTENVLLAHESLGRMAGDVALKMMNEASRGGRSSLEFASTFICALYKSEETPEQRYPTDVKRLQDATRQFRNSLHYWAAWQLCQDLDGFDFVRNRNHLSLLLLNAGMIQIALARIPYFSDWNPWMVPKGFIRKIDEQRLNLLIPAETSFEREFAVSYRNKKGRTT